MIAASFTILGIVQLINLRVKWPFLTVGYCCSVEMDDLLFLPLFFKNQH